MWFSEMSGLKSLKTGRAPCAFLEETIWSNEGDDGGLRAGNFRANPV